MSMKYGATRDRVTRFIQGDENNSAIYDGRYLQFTEFVCETSTVRLLRDFDD